MRLIWQFLDHPTLCLSCLGIQSCSNGKYSQIGIFQVILEFHLITTVASEFNQKKPLIIWRISMNIPWKNGIFSKKHPTGGQPPWDFWTTQHLGPPSCSSPGPEPGGKVNKSSTNERGVPLYFTWIYMYISILMYIDVSCICEFCFCFFKEDLKHQLYGHILQHVAPI